MVIIVVDGIGRGRAPIARSLAVELGWRLVDGDESLSGRALHDVAAHAIDRREHTVVARTAGSPMDYDRLSADLRPIRVVLLRAPASHPSARSSGRSDGGDRRVLLLDGTWPPERILGAIREEFGV